MPDSRRLVGYLSVLLAVGWLVVTQGSPAWRIIGFLLGITNLASAAMLWVKCRER